MSFFVCLVLVLFLFGTDFGRSQLQSLRRLLCSVGTLRIIRWHSLNFEALKVTDALRSTHTGQGRLAPNSTFHVRSGRRCSQTTSRCIAKFTAGKAGRSKWTKTNKLYFLAP